MENIILNNKLECPVVGIGTFMLSPRDAENSVTITVQILSLPSLQHGDRISKEHDFIQREIIR